MKQTILLMIAGISLSAWAGQEEVGYTYDDAGRLVTTVWSVGYSNAAAHYQYDANGSRTDTLHIAANDTSVDSNNDGMPDLGELAYFGGLNVDGAADPDGDGLVNSNEMALLGNPFRADTDDDLMSDVEEAIAGSGLNNPGSFFGITNLSAAAGAARASWWTKAGRTYQFQSGSSPTSAWTDTGAPYHCGTDGSYSMEQPVGTASCFRTSVRMTE